jgi:hypothetical protein
MAAETGNEFVETSAAEGSAATQNANTLVAGYFFMDEDKVWLTKKRAAIYPYPLYCVKRPFLEWRERTKVLNVLP